MSIEDRIAEIARKHFPEYISGACLCGASVDNLTQWAAHVARVLTTELRLTEERAIGLKHPPFGRPGSLIAQDHLDFQRDREIAAASQDLTEYTRYVTPWETT